MISRNAWEHGLNVTLWAGIGALIAISVAPPFWWAGLLVGATGAYLATDFRQIRSAASRAWQTAGGWKPPEQQWWIRRLQAAFWGANVGTLLVPVVIMVYLFGAGTLVSIVSIGMGVYFLLLLSILSVAHPAAWEGGWSGWRYNFIPVYGWYLPRYGVPWVLRSIVRFTQTFFLLIHSQKRVLRAMDTLIGAGTGSAFGEGLATVAIAGAIGFLVGIAHWQIVSVRWLKIVPNS